MRNGLSSPGAGSRLLPSAHALRLVDIAMALWVAAWIGLGVAIGINIHQLIGLSHTVSADGKAVQEVGKSLSAVAGVPFVGKAIGSTAQQVQSAGASAVASGASSASSIRTLSVLLAVAVALLPSMPVFGFYLPLRLARRRETRAVRKALREHGLDAGLTAFLAQRAVVTLDYDRLRDAANASGAAGKGQGKRLAAAELRRLGIDPRRFEDWEGSGPRRFERREASDPRRLEDREGQT